jgi:PAS domain S-box-containing protein
MRVTEVIFGTDVQGRSVTKEGSTAPSPKPFLRTRLTAAATMTALALILITTMAGILFLFQNAASSRKAQLALTELRHDLDQQSALQARAMGDPYRAAPLIYQSRSIDEEINESLDRLDESPVPDDVKTDIRAKVAAYQFELQSELDDLVNGEWSEAWSHDQEVARPAFEQLADHIDHEVSILGQAADQRDRTAATGMLVIMVFGAGLCGLVGWQRNKAQTHVAQQRAVRKSEERFRSLVQNASDVIVVVGDNEIVQYVTTSAEKLFGMPNSALQDSNILSYAHPDDRQNLRDAMSSVRAGTSNNMEAFEWRVGDAPQWRDVECLINDLSHDPNVGGLVLTLRDITDRHALESELRQSQKLEAIGRLAGGIAHEINTPLQFSRDNVEFLTEAFEALLKVNRAYGDLLTSNDAMTDEQRVMISAVNQETDLDFLLEQTPTALTDTLDGLGRVATIVQSMKQFAHPDSKAMMPTDLNGAIANTVVIASSAWKEKAQIVTDFGDIPSVMCHIGELNQVWLNLIVNAADAIEDAQRGRGTITIRTRSEGDHVTIEISDTGCGIPESVSANVFDPFFTTKEVGRGTGQGLTMARTAIVDRHHGTIHFNTSAMGTTFVIQLPVHGSAAGLLPA